jgi:fucose permease
MASQNQTSTPYLMATACAGLFTYGVVASFLGATLPELRARSGIDFTQEGTLFSFLYIPQVPMVFLAGPLIDRFGKKLVLAAGFLCSAGALMGMAGSPSYALLGALLFILGLGSSSAMAAANTLIPDLYPENPSSGLNMGGIFFGVGAAFFPWLVAVLTHRFVTSLWCIALLVGLVAVVALAQKFPPASMAGGFDWNRAMSLVVNPAVIILAGVLFFYTALEVSTNGWIRTFLQKDLAASPETSKIILTTFWIMMMAGRLIASQAVKRIRGPQLVLGSALGAVAGLLLIALAHDVWMATAGAVLCGLSYAPIFPTTAGTASTYFSRIFGTVFGMLMAFALLSGVVVPPAIGYVAQHQSARSGTGIQHESVRSGFWILVGIAILLFFTQLIFNSYERRKLLPSEKQA